mgnify:CR=1 FL=1
MVLMLNIQRDLQNIYSKFSRNYKRPISKSKKFLDLKKNIKNYNFKNQDTVSYLNNQ